MAKCSQDHRAVLHNDYPTIGLLIESLSGSYQSGIWPGISEVAQREKFNVICFTGGALMDSPDDPWEKQRNILYDIAENNGLDGIILSGSLCSYVDDDVIDRFVNRFKNMPLVTLLPLSPEVPSVYVDNKRGMVELINHLVQEHQYERFAFIKGPDNNPEADERLRLFKDLLGENGIVPKDSDLAPGAFNRESGAEAIDLFYGNGDAGYDVIVCADDETALGAIERLRELGYEVPDDVTVVGFDDAEESTYMTPPITTVAQPLKELGSTACDLLVRRIRGEDVPFETILDARLVVRQSCGCFEPSVKKTQIRKALIESVAARNSLSSDKLYAHLSQRLKNNLEMFHFDFPQLREMVTDFCLDVNEQKSTRFLQTIDRIGRMKILRGSNLIKWNYFFSTLWRYILSHLDRETFSFADSLLHEARIIRGDLVLRAQGYRRIQANREYNFIHEIGEQISNTIDRDKLLQVIAEELPVLGIDTFYVCYYCNSQDPVAGAKLALSVEGGVIMSTPDDSTAMFDTPELLPDGTISSNSLHTIVSEPLYFHDEMFGVLYFLVDSLEYDTNIFEVLGTYISNALHSGYLIGKVEEQSAVLREQNRELEELRKKEHAYLEAIKRELELGRKIQQSFLPQEIYQPVGYDISVNFTPAREVSGDFYDVFPFDDDLVGLIIADVSGKDVSAAMFMSLVKTLLRVFGESSYREGKSPLEAVAMVNEYVIKHHQQPKGRCMFVTMIYGVLRPSTGEFSYVNAGHNPALIYSGSEVVERLSPTAPAVGLAAGLPFPELSCVIDKGAQLYAYTDGVTEAQNSDGEFFTLDRVISLLTENGVKNSEEVVSLIVKELEAFTKDTEPFDDITMMSVCRG